MNAIRDSITSTISLLSRSHSHKSPSNNRRSFSNPYAKMAAQTPAQEEFAAMLGRAARGPALDRHPEDDRDKDDEQDEEAAYQQRHVDEQMQLPSGGSSGGRLNLPPPSFDSGRTTGVKGVIADARSFEEARRGGAARRGAATTASGPSLGRINGAAGRYRDDDDGDDDDSAGEDEEEFLERWREERRREMAREGNDIRNRRTSPSMSRYGRFDTVDALGYLDSIEKVGRDTVVVVFVYDVECPVSQVIEAALTPLVAVHPAIHFVKVHYDEIEFDNAGVPAILAYRQQGELFANLTYVIDQIPEDTLFDTKALREVLGRHGVL